MLPAALSASRATSQGYRSGCIRPNPLSTGSQSRLRPRRLPDHAGRMTSAPVDYTRTSARPAFAALPEPVRAEIARLAGAPVQAADPPVGSGFTGSYAGVLHLINGRRVFAKAGGPAMPHVITGLRREAEVVPLLAGLACVPTLIGAAQVDGWAMLVLEHIDGHQPGMPWTARDADLAHAACLEVASLPPERLEPLHLTGLAEDVAANWGIDGAFGAFARGQRDWPHGIRRPSPEEFAELAALAGRAGTALRGDALCHNDVRPDNLLITADRAMLVDWNWVRASPPWFDLVGLWPQMAHDGIDLARFDDSPLLADADPEDIDCFLAVIVAYMIEDVDAPPPPGCTDALRRHQLWQAALFLDLLAARRGW